MKGQGYITSLGQDLWHRGQLSKLLHFGMYCFAQTSYSILDDIMTDISSPFNKIILFCSISVPHHFNLKWRAIIGSRSSPTVLSHWSQRNSVDADMAIDRMYRRSLRPSFSGQFHGFSQRSMERQWYWKRGRGLITVRKLIWELLEAAVPGKILHWFSLYSLKCLMRNAFLPLLSKKFVQIYIWFSKKLYICRKVLNIQWKVPGAMI